MKWPGRKWLMVRHDPDPDGERAKDEAEEKLAEAAEQWLEVRRVSASLRNLREKNHFAQTVETIFKGSR